MKKPIYTDFIKKYDKTKPDAEFVYNRDLEKYCEALNNYCEELEKRNTKIVKALVDIKTLIDAYFERKNKLNEAKTVKKVSKTIKTSKKRTKKVV